MKKLSYGEIFFEDIETIRCTIFSHYLISNESILELNAMKAMYLELKEISNMLDELKWGILYPFYCFYQKIKRKIKKVI